MSFPHTLTSSLIENEHVRLAEEMPTNPNGRAGTAKDSDDETYNGPSIVIECVKRKKKKNRHGSDHDDSIDTSSRSSKSSRTTTSRSSKRSKSSRRSKTSSPKARRRSSRRLSSSSSSSRERSRSKKALKRRASLDALTNRHAVLPTETLAKGLSDRHLNFEDRLDKAKTKRMMVQSSIQDLMAEENEEEEEEEVPASLAPTVMPLDIEEPTNTALCQSGPPLKQRPSLVATAASQDRATAQQRRGLDDWKRHLSFRHILDNYTYNPASFDDHFDEDEVSLGELPEGIEDSQTTIDLEASRAIETFGDEECPSDSSDRQANISKFLEAMEPRKRSAFRVSMIAIWVTAGIAMVLLFIFIFTR